MARVLEKKTHHLTHRRQVLGAETHHQPSEWSVWAVFGSSSGGLVGFRVGLDTPRLLYLDGDKKHHFSILREYLRILLIHESLVSLVGLVYFGFLCFYCLHWIVMWHCLNGFLSQHKYFETQLLISQFWIRFSLSLFLVEQFTLTLFHSSLIAYILHLIISIICRIIYVFTFYTCFYLNCKFLFLPFCYKFVSLMKRIRERLNVTLLEIME